VEVKLRLLAGTINDYTAEEGWKNYTLDVAERPVWDHDLEGFVMPDFIADITDGVELAGLREEMFDEIRFHHVLEHVPVDRAPAAVKTLFRLLKPGGELDIEVPNVDAFVRAYSDGELDLAGLSQWVLGEQLSSHTIYDCHRSVWTEQTIRGVLNAAGFRTPHEKIHVGYAIRFRAAKPT
jgi:2-polyprenyl-3-methyl-5-hydroxy-6-metoxy-1,4-benzoquinol methylase